MSKIEHAGIKFKGIHHLEHWRNGKLIGKYILPNGVTNEGKNYALETCFHSGTAIATWYLGLMDNAGYTTVAAGDVMSSHASWTEFTNYNETNRPTWVADAAAGQAISNTTLATFTINATGVLKGVFLTSSNTKSGTTGKLWATALFTPSTISVVATDVIRNTYTITAT